MNITHFFPCGVDLLYPKAAIGVVRTLEKLGHRVVVSGRPGLLRPAGFQQSPYSRGTAPTGLKRTPAPGLPPRSSKFLGAF